MSEHLEGTPVAEPRPPGKKRRRSQRRIREKRIEIAGLAIFIPLLFILLVLSVELISYHPIPDHPQEIGKPRVFRPPPPARRVEVRPPTPLPGLLQDYQIGALERAYME